MNVSSQGRIDRSVLKYVDPSTSGRTDLRLRRGDVLFNNTNSPELVGKTALFDEDDEPAFSNHMTRLRTDPAKLDPAYLALRLHQAWREGYFAEHCNNHVSQASVSRDVLRDFQTELPPLEVQQAIVALSRSVDGRGISSRNHLAAAKRAVERFRQAVLAAACSGSLTADWREDTKEALGKALLNEIDYLRNRQYREPAADWELDIPETWELVSLDRLTTLTTSGSRGWAKYYSQDGPRFIRAQNISTDRLNLQDIAHVRPPRGSEGERTQVQKDDLLVTITGANVTKSAFVDRDIGEAYVNQHVALVRPVLPELSEYLHLWTVSPRHGRKKLSADAYGAGKPGLNLDNIRTMPVGLPPLDEQAEIAARVRTLLTLADHVAERTVAAVHQVTRSSQAVLANAFRGDLMPVDTGAPTADEEA